MKSIKKPRNFDGRKRLMGPTTTIGPTNFQNYTQSKLRFSPGFISRTMAMPCSHPFVSSSLYQTKNPTLFLSRSQSQWMLRWNTTFSTASSSLSFSLSSSLSHHRHHHHRHLHRIKIQEYLHERQNPFSTGTNHRTNSSTSRKWRRLSWTRVNEINTVVFVITTTTTTIAMVFVAVVFVTVPTTSRWWPRRAVTVLTVRSDRIRSLLCFPKDSYLLPVHLLVITRTLIPLPLSSAIFQHSLRVLQNPVFAIL